jgi:hypothetical protein
MENIQFIIRDYDKSKLGIGNIIKCLISALSVNPDTVIQCYPDYQYGAFDTILDDRFIFKGQGAKELEKVYTCRLLVLRHEEEYQQDITSEEWYLGGLENPRFHYLFSFTKRIDWNYDASLVDDHVKHRVFRVMDNIRFTDVVYHEVNRIASQLDGLRTLGVSVRTWKASHEHNIDRPYEFGWYCEMMERALKEKPDTTTVVLSIDNVTFLEPYLEWCRARRLHVLVLDKLSDWNDIQYAIIKVLVLARCATFIGNRKSTFTELVFWFGKCASQVYTVG